MKKKLKGLIALIMAIAMVVPMTTYAFGAISEDDYNNVLSKGMRVIVEPEVSIEQEAEEGGFNASDFYDVQSEYIGVGEKPIDKACCELEFYNVVGWTIWEVQTSGYVLDDSKSKTVSVDYTVTAEDIMEYGLMSSTDSAYLPYIEAILEPKDITIDVYNAAGTTKTGEVSVNIENYMTETLDVPEGYLGYMLYAEHTEYSEDGIQSAFVSDGESLWTELQIMSCFGYEPLKLVPVTKMPYYMNIGGYVNGWEIEEAEIIYLAPGESIAENDYVASHIEHSNFAEEEVAWNVWTINYCGSTSSTPLDDYESDYVFTTTTGLSLEDYKKTRSEIYNDGYSETFYYEANFPVLGIDYSDLEYIEYEIPVYNMDDEYMFDTYVRKCDLVYYAWEIEEYAQREIWTDVSSGETCGFSFEYDGYDYGEVVYYQEIWDIAIEDGNYDYDKAKLKVVCAEHNYQKDSVVEQPTVDKKGKTKYVCSVCGTTKIVEDIDRLVALDSIVLKGSLFTYTGSNIIPGFDVKGYVNGTLTNLKKDVDYTVSYSNNKMPGIGTVTVTGKGKFTGTKTATFKIRPAKVQNLKATAGINRVGLTWNEVVGATGYYIYGAPEGGEFVYIGSTKNTNYISNGLPDGVEYGYKVVAYVSTTAGNIKGAESDIAVEGAKIELDSVTLSTDTFTYTGEYIKPVVTVTAYVNGRKITLTNWQDYKVEYKNFKNPGVASITVTGRGNYYGTLTTTFVIKPNWVTNVSQIVDSTYTKNLRIKWAAVTGVTGYEVYKSTEKLGTYVKVGTVTTTEFISKDLEPGTSYYYKVRAYKTVGSKKVYGNYSNILKATTRTVAPSKPMTKITLLMNNIKWYYSPGAAGYEVYMSNNEKFIGSKIASTTPDVRNISIPGLDTGKTYYVRVRAYTTTATGAKMYTSFSPYASFMAK